MTKTWIYDFKSTQLFKMFQMTCDKLLFTNSVIYPYQCDSVFNKNTSHYSHIINVHKSAQLLSLCQCFNDLSSKSLKTLKRSRPIWVIMLQ